MKNPKVSVVMPVYNTGKFLRETIESVLNQTLKEIELIIVNDASKDNSLEIIREYAKKDKRIVLVNHSKNKGVSKSMNDGIKKSKGKYVAILGSDDLFLPKKLEIQFNFLEKHPEIFLVGSSGIYVDENGKEINRFRKYNNYKILAWRLPHSCSFIHSSTLARNTKEFWYDEDFKSAVDYKYYLELIDAGKNLTNIPLFLAKYRVHSSSISVSKKKQQEYFRDKAKEMYKHLGKRTKLSDKIIFSIKLLLFYIKTYKEKRPRN
jgi:glycosyltransferase involved in cell wall biosynthesis